MSFGIQSIKRSPYVQGCIALTSAEVMIYAQFSPNSRENDDPLPSGQSSKLHSPAQNPIARSATSGNTCANEEQCPSTFEKPNRQPISTVCIPNVIHQAPTILFVLASTLVLWPLFLRWISKFSRVCSGPGVYSFPGQSLQRIRGSH
jgi:hypothetical protein